VYVEEEQAEEYGIIDQLERLTRNEVAVKQGTQYYINIHSVERMDDTPANIIFRYAPEQPSANIYRHISLVRPLPVTDDNIPLMVNEQWHEALIDGVLGMTEYYQYGSSDRLQTFNEYWCKKFWGQSDRMPRVNKILQTPVRKF